MNKIYYQGEPGCFSEIAAEKMFGKDINKIGLETFEDVVRSVIESKDDLGILPVENTIIGKISTNYDLLLYNPVFIVSEIKIKIRFNLMTSRDVRFEDIEEIWSHPAALEQCKNYILKNNWKPVAIYDTAGGAKLLKENHKRNIAILADSEVSKKYGLKILEKGVEDNSNNFTRFYIITGKKKRLNRVGELKSSIAFGVKNVPGILFKCLSVFALRNINLLSIESRPIKGKPWEYIFFIDFEGDINEENCAKAVESLKEIVGFLKIFGSFVSVEK